MQRWIPPVWALCVLLVLTIGIQFLDGKPTVRGAVLSWLFSVLIYSTMQRFYGRRQG